MYSVIIQKKIGYLCFLVFILFSNTGLSQNKTEEKRSGFAFTISSIDYSTVMLAKEVGLSKAIKDGNTLSLKDKSIGLGLSYWYKLKPKLLFSGNLSTVFSSLPVRYVTSDSVGVAKLKTHLDGLLHLYALNGNATINPFITVGGGISHYTNSINGFIPLGVGLFFNFKSEGSIILQMQMRKSLSASAVNNHLNYSISFAQFNLGGSKKQRVKKEIKNTEVVKKDTDGDGILDELDKCPKEKGIGSDGCPDSDNDGIADKDDLCKNVFGYKRYNGCPIPDSDNDKVDDEKDFCKDQPGIIENNGCPWPDNDKDGIIDKDDKCPDIAGLFKYAGCPVPILDDVYPNSINSDSACYRCYFDFDEDRLTTNTFSILSGIKSILINNPNLNVSIEGHSDTKGTPKANLLVSKNRAEVVKKYFISYNINADRISTSFYGSSKMLDPKQEWTNRRVEICIKKTSNN